MTRTGLARPYGRCLQKGALRDRFLSLAAGAIRSLQIPGGGIGNRRGRAGGRNEIRLLLPREKGFSSRPIKAGEKSRSGPSSKLQVSYEQQQLLFDSGDRSRRRRIICPINI